MPSSEPFISQTLLEEFAGKQNIAEALNAMDTLSIRSFSYDRRGRIEAGVRPAPNSPQKPSHAKITRRGSRYQPECLTHGRGEWCIHTIILALHYMGTKPEYKVKKPAPPEIVKKNQLILIMTYQPPFFLFSVFNTANQRRIPSPGEFLVNNFSSMNMKRESIEELIEIGLEMKGKGLIQVRKEDMAPVLFSLKTYGPEPVPLYLTPQTAFTWDDLIPQPPTLHASWKPGHLDWQWEGKQCPEPGDIWIPGHPGFRIRNRLLTMFPHLTSLDPFYEYSQGSSSPSNVDALLEKCILARHQIQWATNKPRIIHQDAPIGICLRPQENDLLIEIGIMQDQHFHVLDNTHNSLQYLSDQTITYLPARRLDSIQRHLKALRLPVNQASIRLKGSVANDFLKNADLPETWHILRQEADNWFGSKQVACEVLWDPDTKTEPTYLIQGEEWEHRSLMDHLLASRTGIRLSSGQILNFDTTHLVQNNEILSSLNRAFESSAQKLYLLRRILNRPLPIPPRVDSKWNKVLRPYQKQGLVWMMDLKQHGLSGLLADDMGLGKTVQTLAFLESCKGSLPQLVVVPKTLLSNWSSEALRFTPKRKLTLYHGINRSRTAEELQKADLVLTTYGTVLRDEELLYDVHFDTVVLDEAQAVKNPDAKTTQAIGQLWSDTRLALTGTPIENHLGELWSIFQFLTPDLLGERKMFQGIIPPASPFFQAVRKKITPLTLRRIKNQVELDLPEKQEITIKIPLSKDQKKLYHAYLASSQQKISQHETTNVPSLLTLLLRLRQICCHPGLVSECHLSAKSCKFDFLLGGLQDIHHEGHAALVFSQFTQLLQLFKYDLEEKGIPFLYLDGKTRNRQDLVDRFQKGEGTVFLISLKAGGTGLNLTRASYVYHLDPWWNPMVEAQATDRTHRIGQNRKVLSYKLITEGTIEEAIQSLQQKKKELAESLWDDSGQTLPTGLNQKELLDLIEGLPQTE